MEGIVIAIISALVSLAAVIATIVKSKGENSNAYLTAKASIDAQIDARVEEQLKTAWARIDVLEKAFKALESRETRRMGAITRILRTIANQWPGTTGPDLDPMDIAEIEETIPPAWIRTPPRSRANSI